MIYYSMKEAATIIGFPFGRNILYDYLKQLGIIQHNLVPYQEFLSAGYFYYGYGSQNFRSPRKFKKTVVTPEGIEWLWKDKYNDIMELDRLYLEQHLKKK